MVQEIAFIAMQPCMDALAYLCDPWLAPVALLSRLADVPEEGQGALDDACDI